MRSRAATSASGSLSRGRKKLVEQEFLMRVAGKEMSSPVPSMCISRHDIGGGYGLGLLDKTGCEVRRARACNSVYGPPHHDRIGR